MASILSDLPPEPRGYAIEQPAGLIHARYPTHETGHLHRTSPRGVLNIMVDHQLAICEDCYPPPAPAAPEPKRKSRSKATPAAVVSEPAPPPAEETPQPIDTPEAAEPLSVDDEQSAPDEETDGS